MIERDGTRPVMVVVLAVFLSVAVIAAMPSLSNAQGTERDYPVDELIVKLVDEGTSSRVSSALGDEVQSELDTPVSVEQTAPDIGVQTLQFPEVESAAELSEIRDDLNADPRVESADFNYYLEPRFTPDDPQFERQYYLNRVNAPNAWDTGVGEGILIGVVDSGIQASHPDLRDKVVAQRDFAGSGEDARAEDQAGHGTSVSGVSAADTDNGVGISGTCPECGIIAAKFTNFNEFRPGEGTIEDSIEAIDYAVRKGADVLNLSYGRSTQFSDNEPIAAEEAAIDAAVSRGVVVVGAVDNARTGREDDFPAAYENVIAVASTDRQDRSQSNFGDHVDISAPGQDNRSTDLTGSDGYSGGDYATLSGTSFASPQVAAVAGLLIGTGLSGEDARERIECTATDLGAEGRDDRFGYGLMDAEAAISGDCGGTPSPSPTGCTVRGTAGDDRLRGTAGRDVICGFGGDDEIAGLAGNDTIRGGDGRDGISGGSGDDTVYGGAGNDDLSGDDGRDNLRGGTGDDRLYGGPGRDSLNGGPGNNRVVQ